MVMVPLGGHAKIVHDHRLDHPKLFFFFYNWFVHFTHMILIVAIIYLELSKWVTQSDLTHYTLVI